MLTATAQLPANGLTRSSHDEDRERDLHNVSFDGYRLQHASDESKDDREIVLAAVGRHGAALQHASEARRADYDIVQKAVGKNGAALEYASLELRSDPKIVAAAVKQYGPALQWAADALQSDIGFLRKNIMPALIGTGNFLFRVTMLSGRSCAIIGNRWDSRNMILQSCRDRIGLTDDQMRKAVLVAGTEEIHVDSIVRDWAFVTERQVNELQLIFSGE
mmetsp:Transcript_46832/g.111428  ORF Transcript_46832/g.111428 Transcript_46832/m.111428 type:complete len:219 (-) Transcript_46832:31-687(-)